MSKSSNSPTKSEIAKGLGITRQALWYRIKTLGESAALSATRDELKRRPRGPNSRTAGRKVPNKWFNGRRHLVDLGELSRAQFFYLLGREASKRGGRFVTRSVDDKMMIVFRTDNETGGQQ